MAGAERGRAWPQLSAFSGARPCLQPREKCAAQVGRCVIETTVLARVRGGQAKGGAETEKTMNGSGDE